MIDIIHSVGLSTDPKCASNDALLELMAGLAAEEFKQLLMERIRRKGLTFKERHLVSEICDMATLKGEDYGSRHNRGR